MLVKYVKIWAKQLLKILEIWLLLKRFQRTLKLQWRGIWAVVQPKRNGAASHPVDISDSSKIGQYNTANIIASSILHSPDLFSLNAQQIQDGLKLEFHKQNQLNQLISEYSLPHHCILAALLQFSKDAGYYTNQNQTPSGLYHLS